MPKPFHRLCSVAAALEVFGDAWTLQIVREALYGATRFSEFERHTGAAKNVLADRLALLVEHGVFEKVDIGERGVRYAYRLTEKGEALAPVLLAVIQWGDRWIYGEGREPVVFRNAETGAPPAPLTPLWADGSEVKLSEVAVAPGPGADDAVRRRFSGTGG